MFLGNQTPFVWIVNMKLISSGVATVCYMHYYQALQRWLCCLCKYAIKYQNHAGICRCWHRQILAWFWHIMAWLQSQDGHFHEMGLIRGVGWTCTVVKLDITACKPVPMYCKDSIHFKEPLSNTIENFKRPLIYLMLTYYKASTFKKFR